jgi:hypothetical protein
MLTNALQIHQSTHSVNDGHLVAGLTKSKQIHIKIKLERNTRENVLYTQSRITEVANVSQIFGFVKKAPHFLFIGRNKIL